jgi:predicted glycoside hydrolase/deacetylase ChbG (UPF0249 family)
MFGVKDKKKFCCLLVVLLAAGLWLGVSAAGKPGAKATTAGGEIRLIVRADDIGSSHAANLACIKSYREGIARSVEVMGHKGYWNVAAHRDAVTRAFTSKKVKSVIEKRGIRLISYRDLSGD